MLEYAHIFLSLITSVIFIIISLSVNRPTDKILFNLIFIIAISYVLGLLLRRYLKSTVFKIEDIDLSDEVSKLLAEEEAMAQDEEKAYVGETPPDAPAAPAANDTFDFDGFDE